MVKDPKDVSRIQVLAFFLSVDWILKLVSFMVVKMAIAVPSSHSHSDPREKNEFVTQLSSVNPL